MGAKKSAPGPKNLASARKDQAGGTLKAKKPKRTPRPSPEETVQLRAEEREMKHRAFLDAYMSNGFNQTEAMLQVSPGLKRSSASDEGRRMLREIRTQKTFEEILDEYGLDDYRLVGEMNRLLHLKRPVFYQGVQCGEHEDGQTQAKMVELLAELRGRKKLDVELRGGMPLIIVHSDSEESDAENTPEEDA
jgi:hypothetical protein